MVTPRDHITRLLGRAAAPRDESLRAARGFLVGLALAHACFFVSLVDELLALVGSEGLLPAEHHFGRVSERLGLVGAVLRLPSLAWLSTSDTMLRALVGTGLASSIALGAVVVARPRASTGMARALLAALYALALSLLAVGQSFLAFQWDLLLVEATVVALFFAGAPGGRAPSHASVFLLRLLVVKLMMSSGLGKLATGDETWRDLSALSFHLFTQPLPNPIAVVLASTPDVLLHAATLVTLVVQIVLPPLVFLGARARGIAVVVLALHQLAIAATGNFAYFNLLTLALLVGVCDDELLPRIARRTIVDDAPAPPRQHQGIAWLHLAPVALLVVLSLQAFVGGVARSARALPVVGALADALAPLRLSSRYGLFTVMTTTRHEIVFEGTRDGVTWTPFVLPHQPGPVDRWPSFVAPLHPRLDWQLWFAALSSHERHPFVVATMRALVEGRPSVRALFDDPPFRDAPPRAVRAWRYEYRLAPPERRRRDGVVWERTLVGPYAPMIGAQRFDDVSSAMP